MLSFSLSVEFLFQWFSKVMAQCIESAQGTGGGGVLLGLNADNMRTGSS